MSNSDLGKDFELSSGNSCQLLRVRKGLIPNYCILAFPKTQGEPNPEEVSEMLTLGTSHAQKLAEEFVRELYFLGEMMSRNKRMIAYAFLILTLTGCSSQQLSQAVYDRLKTTECAKTTGDPYCN